MKFKPYPYQQYCIDRIVNDPAVGLFLDMGLGKTVITLSATFYDPDISPTFQHLSGHIFLDFGQPANLRLQLHENHFVPGYGPGQDSHHAVSHPGAEV